MMYDGGAVGLNLHVACVRVLSLDISKFEGQSIQLAGRANRGSNFLALVDGAQKCFRTSLLIHLIGEF